jgi:hypothetical protein
VQGCPRKEREKKKRCAIDEGQSSRKIGLRRKEEETCFVQNSQNLSLKKIPKTLNSRGVFFLVQKL